MVVRRSMAALAFLSQLGLLRSKDEPKRKRRKLSLQERRNRSGKLRRESLPNPNHSPFMCAYNSKQDDALIAITGFDHGTFQKLLDLFKPWFDSNTPIKETGRIGPRNPRSFGGRPRSVTALTGLAMTLVWYRTRGSYVELQKYFGLSYTVVSLWMRFSRILLLRILLKHPDAKVALPTNKEVHTFQQAIKRKYPAIPDVWGAVDGLKLSLERAPGYTDQNRYYNGWYHEHTITNLFLFTPDGKIRFSSVNSPGSYHDSKVALNSKFYDSMEGYYKRFGGKAMVVADRAYAGTAGNGILCAKQTVRCKTRRVPVYRYKKKVRDSATKLRQLAEWGMKAFKSSIPRLHDRIRFETRGERRFILTLAVLLYNFRVHHVGQNQIKTVFIEALNREVEHVLESY
jgi:DDE superfamily endonuclease